MAETEIGLRKDDLDTPALWVDLQALEDNVRWLGQTFKSARVGWRPHVKGIKVPAIAHLALAAGAHGVTCAKLGEAEVMAAAGIRDILIANQVVTYMKMERLAALQQQASVKVAVDQADNAAALGRAAVARGVVIGVVVEVDIGLARAGVAPGQAAVDLSLRVHDTPGLQFLGLMAWEGHARRVMGLDARRPVIEKALDLLLDTAGQCRASGLEVQIVSAGGTGTFYVTAHRAGITEIQAGGAVFGEVASQAWEVGTRPALYVRTTVTSRPTPERIIVDAGFKALPAWHNVPRPISLAGVANFYTSAEHGTLTLSVPPGAVLPRIGEALDFLVGYGDETVCLHDTLYGVRGERVETAWSILGRGKLR